MAKMDPSAADMALAMWNGYVHDARRHARQRRPVEQVLQHSNGAYGSRSSCQKQVFFVARYDFVFSSTSTGCMLLL
jgi:hypothetical protein